MKRLVGSHRSGYTRLSSCPDKSKLSKRHGAVRFLDYKERGFLPEAMINFIALLGWSSGEEQEVFSVEELIQRFTIQGIANHPAVFDIQKAEWMNGVYIRRASAERIADLCLPYLQSAGLVTENPTSDELAYVRQVVVLEQDRMKVLSDVVELTKFFFVAEPEYDDKGMKKFLVKDYTPELLRSLASGLEQLSEFTVTSVEEAVRSAGEALDISGGQVIHPVRMAVTGRTTGPVSSRQWLSSASPESSTVLPTHSASSAK